MRFVPISALFVILTAFFPDLVNVGPLGGITQALHIPPTGLVLGLVFAGIFLFTVTFNIMYDPYQALLADITPERQRGRVNGVFQALGASGQSCILIIGAFFLGAVGGVTGLFLICGISLAVFFVPTVMGVREPRQLPGVEHPKRYTVRDYWHGITSDPQVGLYYVNQAFLWFGINAITPYLTLYAEKEVGFTFAEALRLDFILLLASAVFV
jgi:Na+/melibiose symporter-like transporter